MTIGGGFGCGIQTSLQKKSTEKHGGECYEEVHLGTRLEKVEVGNMEVIAIALFAFTVGLGAGLWIAWHIDIELTIKGYFGEEEE